MNTGISIRSLYPLRAARGWTQAETAARCGISTATYGRLEAGRGNPSPATLAALARVFQLRRAALQETTR